MKKFISLIFFSSIVFFGWSQAPEYNDLKILFADGNYEKLIKVAENYTLKENLAKDPLPFLWLAKGLHKISLSGNSDEKYKTAYKDAIAAMSKVFKNDKDGAVITDNKEFVDQFQLSMVELIKNDLDMKDYSKASGWVLKYYKVTKKPLGAKYLDGATKFRKADKGGANTSWKEAEIELAKVTDFDTWSPADQAMLKMGVLQTAECYKSSKQVDKSKALLNKVAQWFEEDEEFKEKYDEIVN